MVNYILGLLRNTGLCWSCVLQAVQHCVAFRSDTGYTPLAGCWFVLVVSSTGCSALCCRHVWYWMQSIGRLLSTRWSAMRHQLRCNDELCCAIFGDGCFLEWHFWSFLPSSQQDWFYASWSSAALAKILQAFVYHCVCLVKVSFVVLRLYGPKFSMANARRPCLRATRKPIRGIAAVNRETFEKAGCAALRVQQV